jgi:hypothetical protein
MICRWLQVAGFYDLPLASANAIEAQENSLSLASDYKFV